MYKLFLIPEFLLWPFCLCPNHSCQMNTGHTRRTKRKTHSSLWSFRSDSKCLTSTPALACLHLAQLALFWSQYLEYRGIVFSRNWLDKSVPGKKWNKVLHRNSVQKEDKCHARSPRHVLQTYLLLLLLAHGHHHRQVQAKSNPVCLFPRNSTTHHVATVGGLYVWITSSVMECKPVITWLLSEELLGVYTI